VDLPEAVTRPETRDQYIISSLIQESITSSQLEGAATTREVAKELLRTGRPPRDKSERMILNNYLTMQRIRDLQAAELSPALVLELQSRVTDGTLEKPDASGRLRRSDEAIQVTDEEGTVFYDPPPATQLADRLTAMCAFANGQAPDCFVHPVIRAIILHFWLAYDHPFVDGNGRTARALFYWSMLRQGYSLFEFISISQILLRAPVRYAEAFLHTETDGNDLTYFILHQAGVIREAVEALHAYVRHKTTQLRATEKKLRGLDGLNHRQQAVLSHALREAHTRYVIVSHQRSHNVTHQTARDDLFDLVQRGLLTVRKEGRSYAFYAPTDLGEKLSKLAERVGEPLSALPDATLPLGLRPNSDG
jgi:Fic family protein